MGKELTVDELKASMAALETENAKIKKEMAQVLEDTVEAQKNFESSLASLQQQTAGLTKQFVNDGKTYRINAKNVDIDGKVVTDAQIAESQELQAQCIANGYGFIELIKTKK